MVNHHVIYIKKEKIQTKEKKLPTILRLKDSPANIWCLSKKTILVARLMRYENRPPREKDFGHGSGHHLGPVVWPLPSWKQRTPADDRPGPCYDLL